ncbi:MAG: DNA/RNA nuclease SfsA [Thermodesulfobacteriota bacterium]
MKLFTDTEKARFVSRPNRFTVVCRLGTRRIKAYLPNPGRLRELLLPGAGLFLAGSTNPGRKMDRTVVAVERDGRVIPLHTHRTNAVAEYLIGRGGVPGLEGAEVLKREVTVGRSRFDLLCKRGGKDILVEVKSCTLYGERVAMFPDAATLRGRRHMEELAALSASGGARVRGAVLFVVYNPGLEYFLPDYHTDPAFAETFMAVRKRLLVLPVAVGVGADLTVDERARALDVPWDLLEREARDRGSYLVIVRLERAASIAVGGLGRVAFKKGYYVYAGSARRGLAKRVERHRRKRKKPFWHIDYLREAGVFHAALPIRTADDIECALADGLGGFSTAVPGFGSSDCPCGSHLFHMSEDPLCSPSFHALLQRFRMDRLFGRSGPLKRPRCR